MDFFTYLMSRIEDRCAFKKVGDRPLSLNVDGSLCTEVIYNGEIYRIFVQREDSPRSDIARLIDG